MKRYSPILCAAVVAALAVSAFALDTSKLKPSGYVNDFARVMDPAAKQRLENYLGEVERATGAQIAVVTVDTLDGEPVEDVANRLYREWGIGKKGKDEGMLVLLAIHDRKQRAEIGYGLEPIINDARAGDVLRGIRPILRQGNYGGAMLAAAEQFGDEIAQAKGVTLAPLGRRVYRPVQRQSIPWPVLIIGFFVLMWLLGRIGRGGGGGTGFLAGMILGNMMGRGSSGWGGGGFGGGGGSGGGWGGFGGGDSGGGGASSDW